MLFFFQNSPFFLLPATAVIIFLLAWKSVLMLSSPSTWLVALIHLVGTCILPRELRCSWRVAAVSPVATSVSALSRCGDDEKNDADTCNMVQSCRQSRKPTKTLIWCLMWKSRTGGGSARETVLSELCDVRGLCKKPESRDTTTTQLKRNPVVRP